MTARADWVAHLTQYSLEELRRRQSILNQQLNDALAKKNVRPQILERMNIMLDSLTEAIMIRSGYV